MESPKKTEEELNNMARFYGNGEMVQAPWRGTLESRGPELGGNVEAMTDRLVSAAGSRDFLEGEGMGLPRIAISNTYGANSGSGESGMEKLLEFSEGE